MPTVKPAVVTIDGTDYTSEPAIVASTFLGREGHGIPTFSFTLEGGGWSIGMAGYRLGAASAMLLMEVLDVVGVPSWEKLPGSHISTLTVGINGPLAGIHNPLTGKAVVFADFISEHTYDTPS